MVLLMCAHTKHVQRQKATINRNAKHAKNEWNQIHKPQQTYKYLRNENIFNQLGIGSSNQSTHLQESQTHLGEKVLHFVLIDS